MKSNADVQLVAERKQEPPSPPVVTSPLPPQQTIPTPVSHPAQQTIGFRSDGPKSAGQDGKAVEKTSPVSSEERMKALKAALNIQ